MKLPCKILLALTVLGAVSAVSAQPAGQAACPEIPSVTTRGHVELKVAARQATVTLSVSGQAETADQAAAVAARSLSKVLDALERLGVDRRQLPASQYYVTREQDWETGELQGYLCQSSLTLRLSDPSSLGNVIDAALAAGASEISGVTFHAEDEEEVRRRALRQAVQKARSEAEVLADAAGSALGAPRILSTEPGALGLSETVVVTSTAGDTVTVIPVPEVSIGASVTVRWSLLERKAETR